MNIKNCICIFILFVLYALPSLAQKRRDSAAMEQMNTELQHLEQDGWKLLDCNEHLRDKWMYLHMMEETYMANEEGDSVPRYMVCFATCENPSLQVAMQLAAVKARKELATQMETTTDVTTVRLRKVGENISDQFGVSVDKHTRLNLNRVEKVLTIYRKKENQLYEVKVFLALDKMLMCETE